MTDYIASSVMFSPEGIEVTFMRMPDDVRCDGSLVATRSYAISAGHPRFGEDVQDITRAVHELLEDVHVAFDDEPITTLDPDEADLEGMGEG